MDPQTPSAATERARLAVVLTTVAISVGGVVLFSLVPWSDWRTGLLLNLVENAILVAFSIRYRDRLIPHLMLFGFAVGLAELPADAWLVDATGTLDYSIGGGPMIWRSPAWMPLAWEMVAVQFGYLGMRLYEWRKGWGLLLAGADRGGQHPVLRGDGAADALVAVRELPDAPAHAVLHHRRRVPDRRRHRLPGDDGPGPGGGRGR